MSRQIKYEVGKRLWLEVSPRHKTSRYVVVSKVGRKWATITEERGGKVGRVALDRDSMEHDGYSCPGRLWEDYERYCTVGSAWRVLCSDLERVRWQMPVSVTAEKIQQARELLGLGKAG